MHCPPQTLANSILKIVCLLLLVSLRASAQDTGQILGKVQMADGTSPRGVRIYFSGDYPYLLTVMSDNGSFQIALRQGRWEITALKRGYIQRAAEVTVVTNRDNHPLPETIKLNKKARNTTANATKPQYVLIVMRPYSQVLEQSSGQGGQVGDALPKSLKGRIIDETTKLALSGAQVSVHRIKADAEIDQLLARAESNKDGIFEINLKAMQVTKDDEYILSIERPGYQSYHDVLDLGALNRLANSQNIVAFEMIGKNPVDTKAPLTETSEATHRYVFLPQLMESLPVPGLRTFDYFALLAPGVLPPPATFNRTGLGVSSGVGTAGQFAINGLRSRENNFTVDGSDNNDDDIGTRRQGYVMLVPQSIESIQELQVISALGDARFGRDIGGQINALTKYGGHEFHVSAFSFFTNQRLNARDFFDQTTGGAPAAFGLTRSSDQAAVLLDGRPIVRENPVGGEDPFTRTQVGLMMGGRLKPKDSFFFFAFEMKHIKARKESHFVVPTVKQRGVFDTGDTGFSSGGVSLFPASLPGNAIFSLYPFPNNPLGPYGANTFTESLPADGRGEGFSIKTDHRFIGSGVSRSHLRWKTLFSFGAYGDQLVGRYSFNDEKSTIPVTGDALFSSLRPKVHTHNLAFFLDRHLSSHISDSIRVSYGRTKLSFGEVRDPFLLPSSFLPDIPFLLNAPLLLNVTTSNPAIQPSYVSAPTQAAVFAALGYPSITQSEQITGPLGQVIIPGFSPLGVDVFNFPQSRHNNSFQLADTINDVRGKHILTYGFDMRKAHINSVLDRNFRPLAVFGGLDGLSGLTLAATGVPTGLFQTLAVDPNSNISIHFTATNLFFQDSWRLTPNLYFIYGARYELNSVPKTLGRRVERAFDPAVLRMETQQVADNCGGRCADLVGALTSAFPADFQVSFGADRNDIDPRLGFAWNVSGDGKTVVRGGGGLYDGQFPGIVLSQSRAAFPGFLPLNYANFSPRSGNRTFLFNLANPNVRQLDPALDIIASNTLNTLPSVSPITLLVSQLFNLPASLSLGPTALGLDLVLPQRQLKTPQSWQYGVTLERQVSKDSVIAVSYIGTRGVKLLRLATPDLGLNRNRVTITGITPLLPTPATLYPFFSGSESSPQKLISSSFSIARTFFESSATSFYNSLQAEARKRYGNHFSFGTALTYSRATDDASDFFDLAGAFALPQDSLRRSETAAANFDVRLRSISHLVVDVPAFTGLRVFKGWQIATVITAQTGQPYTVNSAYDINRDGNLTDRLDRTSGLIQDSGPVQLRVAPGVNPRSLLAPDGVDGAVGRNSFRAPSLFNVDLALTRTVNLKGRGNFRMRAEIFNLFNRANYGIPGRILESPAFGISTNTLGPARVIQFSAAFRR